MTLLRFPAIVTATLAAVLAAPLAANAQAPNNGLDLPATGYSTWNALACNINETSILEVAQALKREGLDRYYKYFNIDDCYAANERDANGDLQANSTRFPRGLAPVVDELHQLGFKVGIYSSAGLYTCAGYPASLDREQQDARWFAGQGFDLLKYDNCFNDARSGDSKRSRDRYVAMRDALQATGRQMLYMGCQWGEDQVYYWGPTTFNSWRMSGDIGTTFDGVDDRCPCTDSIDCQLAGFQCSVRNILNKAAPLLQKTASKPYPSYADLDSLQVDNGDYLTRDESVTHFSLWAMLKSPLILGNDVRKLTDQGRAILKNADVVALNQDAARRNAQRNWRRGDHELWTVGLAGGGAAAAYVNFGAEAWKVVPSLNETLAQVDAEAASLAMTTQRYDAYDLWANVDFAAPNNSRAATPMAGGPFLGTLPEVTIAPHGTFLVKLVPSRGNSTASSSSSSSSSSSQARSVDAQEAMLLRSLDESMGGRSE